jgi:SAM-dependent methyltransferase
MDIQRHKKIFNTIAPVYNLFYRRQYKGYCELLNKFEAKLSIPEKGAVLDIGCGTGALLQAFLKYGYEVEGVDLAGGMLHHARKRGLYCRLADVVKGLDMDDNTFDLVSASFVAHGLDREKRMVLYSEAKRLSHNKVLIHDYSSRRSPFISLIEFMEGGDYFNFIKDGVDEMKEVFSHVEIIQVQKYNNWYICTV